MNPNSPQSNFELPLPQPEAASSVVGAQEAVPASIETSQSNSSTMPAITHQPAPTQPVVQQLQTPVTQTSQSIVQSPATADDTDLIEKEWVEKAKQIVAATHEDPYTQNKEMSRFKADYLKKRYNKDLRVDET